jgi:hypothetical protein
MWVWERDRFHCCDGPLFTSTVRKSGDSDRHGRQGPITLVLSVCVLFRVYNTDIKTNDGFPRRWRQAVNKPLKLG